MRFLLISEREERLGFTAVAVSETSSRGVESDELSNWTTSLGNSPERGINHSLSDRRTRLRLALVSLRRKPQLLLGEFPPKRRAIASLCPGGGKDTLKIRFIIRLVLRSDVFGPFVCRRT